MSKRRKIGLALVLGVAALVLATRDPGAGARGQGGWQGPMPGPWVPGAYSGSPADAWVTGASFYGNSLLGTAVSGDDRNGYIALGDGSFVSWGD